jgi:uncharacterized protein YqgC (DUF456 family)
MLLGALLLVVGFAGTLLPALPGVPLVFAGLLLAAWSDGFTRVGWPTLVLLGLLTVASVVADSAAATLGARRTGASWQALAGAAGGTVVGLFFGIPGLLLGPFVGAVAGEYLARRDLLRAGRVGVGTWLGLAVAAVVRIAIVLAMVGIFVLSWMI